jgi:hypothetical protein
LKAILIATAFQEFDSRQGDLSKLLRSDRGIDSPLTEENRLFRATFVAFERCKHTERSRKRHRVEGLCDDGFREPSRLVRPPQAVEHLRWDRGVDVAFPVPCL